MSSASVQSSSLTPALTVASIWSATDTAALKTFLTAELSKVVKNAEFLTKLTSPTAMETWTAAFTHSSITTVAGQNYEGLETLGDMYLGAFFVSYVDTILPRSQRTPSYYTELVRYWLGKEQLAIFSQELKLPQYTKVLPEVLQDADPESEETVYEDVFEAFFGALVTIGDTLIKDSVGGHYAKAYLVQFLKSKTILLPEEEIFPPKTALKELYDGLKWGAVRYVLTGGSAGSQVTIKVLDFQGDALALGKGRDRKRAERDAAAKAIKVLKAQNITPSTIAAARPVDQEVEGLKQRISRFLAKYGKYGPLEFQRAFKESGKEGGRIFVELRTTQDYETPKERVVVLARGAGVQERKARIDALQSYVKSHRVT
jgi:dsRNA-specific ribonuclease